MHSGSVGSSPPLLNLAEAVRFLDYFCLEQGVGGGGGGGVRGRGSPGVLHLFFHAGNTASMGCTSIIINQRQQRIEFPPP